MSGMVSNCEGQYCLEGMRGQYNFKKVAGACAGELEADGARIGTFVWEPICKAGGDLQIPEGTKDLPCISIVSSEIMAEIQKPSSQGAFFVLPSQLNGAEYPSDGDGAIVRTIEQYKFDNTGGPRGQLAVHPAAGQFVLDNASNSRRMHGINAVDVIEQETKRLFRLQNGYLELPERRSPEIHDSFKRNLSSLRVLAMLDVPACGLKPSKRGMNKEGTHQVSLVYASAIPVDTYLNRLRSPTEESALEFQKAVAEDELVAQYYGAMCLAASRGKPTKVFLMPLGGGVFCNPWDCIARAMSKAVEMLSKDQLRSLDISALAWDGNPSEASTLREHLGELKKLKE